MIPVALTIAGSDPSGGAGVQADLKTFHQHQVYGEAVITLITVQNTRTVEAVEFLSPDLVTAQIRAVFTDVPPHALKTGALGNAELIEAVATELATIGVPAVVDPVMVSKHGAPLLQASACDALIEHLIPKAFLLTPNLKETEVLIGKPVENMSEMRTAAKRILDMGCTAVLIKGGHLKGAATDLLFMGDEFYEFMGDRIDTPHTHGTGCTYSAAITAQLALGNDLVMSVDLAKQYISRAIRTNPGLGGGSGPVNHWAKTGPEPYR